MAECNGHEEDGKISNRPWLGGDDVTRRLATSGLAMLQKRLWRVEDRLARLEADTFPESEGGEPGVH